MRELLEAPGRRPRRSRSATAGGRFWERLERIPDAELWEAHQRQKLRAGATSPGAACASSSPGTASRRRSSTELETRSIPDVLTDRLRAAVRDLQAGRPPVQRHGAAGPAAVRDADRPVQIVFAGKAHPADRPGQRVIQEIFGRSRSPQLRGRVFILEDYDMRVARFLVQGVDVWLNNPRRPLEASGTSGMKAAQNGVVNARVLDGWWDEGWTGDNGWAIGGRETEPRRGRPGLGRRAGPLPDPRARDRAALLRPRRRRACRRAGWPSCAARWPRRSGASRRRGCSTSTPSRCTCRRRASRLAPRSRRPQPTSRRPRAADGPARLGRRLSGAGDHEAGPGRHVDDEAIVEPAGGDRPPQARNRWRRGPPARRFRWVPSRGPPWPARSRH